MCFSPSSDESYLGPNLFAELEVLGPVLPPLLVVHPEDLLLELLHLLPLGVLVLGAGVGLGLLLGGLAIVVVVVVVAVVAEVVAAADLEAGEVGESLAEAGEVSVSVVEVLVLGDRLRLNPSLKTKGDAWNNDEMVEACCILFASASAQDTK